MNITFILGNGFDIQLGLNSRYSDFLKQYVIPLPQDSELIRDFKNELRKNKNRELWSNAEMAMGDYLGKYSDATLFDYIECVEDFETRMVEYLMNQQSRCVYDRKSKIKEIFTSFLFESYKDVLVRRGEEVRPSDSGNHTYNFVSFNYTNTIDRIIACCGNENSTIRARRVNNVYYTDSFSKVYHIHGTLDSQIIMGVNDERQLNLKSGITISDELRWEIIKPKMNSESRNHWDVPVKQVIRQSDIIYIYGVSFGDTDLLWWQELTKWLKQSSNHKLVVFVRDKRGYNKTLPAAEIRFDRTRRTEILRKLSVEDNDEHYETLLEQIYIVLNTTRLELKDILIPPAVELDHVESNIWPSATSAQ